MNKVKLLITLSIFLILSSNIFAQVEKTVKETKVKIEKVADKAAEAKDTVKDAKEAKMCGSESKTACCSTEAKEMKAEVKKHDSDCICDGCSTAEASMKKGEKMIKKAHAADCDCEGCKVAHAEMKEPKHKAHPKDCSCEGCKKS